ncbi:dihydroxyacetone kinase subunit DhaL [Salinarchaeum sp. Harcht-Bsk1]|uniref:dihydroxyacetone kinase subunit DhaL n=1 Tax=Salinarchaeum sp. Harcht-Bsk1 TaxID=1333523 RepID=UPI0003423F96|nr:dihydroxyacetone kinase subunit DhaL [Salinarchaeum sp. Harcht-Bsk1]AGN02048.1 dihydroxyacetone kinase subunit DhaL [Salinarchaeum sp. Harcht-Bsk1]
MTDEIDQGAAVEAAVQAVADRLADEKRYLTDLDSAIGDADHGANMNRGMQAAVEAVADADEDDPATLVQLVGRTIVSEVGGAAGPLYGGSAMIASKELADGITAESTVAFGEAFLEKVQDRGGANVGDKTMVDALTPAVHTYKKSIEQDDLPPLAALAKAVDAAHRGVDYTVPIRASKGRASYLGWRSVGHQDPGATSTLYILEALLGVAEEHLEGPVEEDATSPRVPDEEPAGDGPAAGGENGPPEGGENGGPSSEADDSEADEG